MSTAQSARKGSVISTVAQSTIFTALALAALVFGSLAGPVASANAADGCADVEVVFARGTNEAPGVGATGQAFVDALTADLLRPIIHVPALLTAL